MNITANVFESYKSVRLKLSPEKNLLTSPQKYGTGINVTGVWSGKKWFVIETYSIRINSSGTSYTAYLIGSADSEISDNSEILRICSKIGIEPPAQIEAEEI